MKTKNLTLTSQKDYALLDSGGGEKLERFGAYTLVRPDPQALWPKKLAVSAWKSADASYERSGAEGKWRIQKQVPTSWEVSLGGMLFHVKPTSFKHTGLFPEQLCNWEFLQETMRETGRPLRVLNLFGYTGGATIAAAQEGAEVTHVDASKTAVAWARENAKLSGLSDAPVRWLVEDALTFVSREIRRGTIYDLIIMDPPAFGRGPKGESWHLETDFIPLLTECQKLLSEKPVGIIMSGYAAGYSPVMFAYNLEQFVEKWGGEVTCGELRIAEEGSERELPCGIYAHWVAKTA